MSCRRLVVVLALLLLVPAGARSQTGAPQLDRLLSRHVPILVLHPAERLAPVAVDGFLADSDLLERTAAGWEKLDGVLPAGGSRLRLDQRLCSARDGVAATACYVDAQAAYSSQPVVYGAARRRGNRVDLQYWLWYPFNPYSPTAPPR